MNRLTDQQYIAAGEIIHYLAILINTILTSYTLLLAIANKPNTFAYYDLWWTSYGFCVVDTLPTELLCFLSLTASAIGQFILCNRLQSGGIYVDPLLISRLESAVFANAAHGFGHIFMYLMGGNTGTYIELSLDPLAVTNICMLSMFWIGTLRSVANLKTTHATLMSTAVLTIQYMLDVPPNLAFTYSQAVITRSANKER